MQLAGLDVSRETVERLQHFQDLVVKWTPRINLIAPASLPDLWQRHIADSAQLTPFVPEGAAHWVDIGSGGGFPGIVMAVVLGDLQFDTRFTLIESDQRKSVFLRTAVRELSLPVTVLADRIDAAPPQAADVVSARALAPLVDLLPLVTRHLSPGGTALLHKGRNARKEVASASALWRFALEDHPSITDPQARILAMKGMSRRDP